MLVENIKNIKIEIKNSKGLIEIDLKKYGLNLTVDGAFVGIEALGLVDDDNTIFLKEENFSTDVLRFELNYQLNKSITYIRSVLLGEWFKIKCISICPVHQNHSILSN
jgi:hypothetical protein